MKTSTSDRSRYGERVYFDQCPEPNWVSKHPYGNIIEVVDGVVTVVDILFNKVYFDVDGSSWSHCGNFKRESWGWHPKGQEF